MRYVGILLALIGILGDLIVFGSFYIFPRPFNTMQPWTIIAGVGIVLYILTRRPRD